MNIRVLRLRSTDWKSSLMHKIKELYKYHLASFPEFMHLSMSSRQGARRGIGQDFDICQKIGVKFPIPGQKCEDKYIITEFPT